MPRFVRFILVVLLIGSGVSLGIVGMRNVASEERRRQDVAAEAKRFEETLTRLCGRARRAQFVVEWQKVGPYERVLETGILLRGFAIAPDGDFVPLAPERFAFQGDRVMLAGGSSSSSRISRVTMPSCGARRSTCSGRSGARTRPTSRTRM